VTKEHTQSAFNQQGQALPAVRLDGATQTISFTGTSAQSSALGSATNLVRLYSTEECFVAFGSNPTASSSTVPLGPKNPEYVQVNPGELIAAISNGTNGTLYITEIL